MRLTRSSTLGVLLPALLLVGWFIGEQLPVWLATPPPWVRYPDLIALPMGCEAALALASAGATFTNIAPDSAIDTALARLIKAQFPQSEYAISVTPRSVRYESGSDGWFALVEFLRGDAQSLARGAALVLNADGTPKEVVHLIGGDSTRGQRCGDFAPQPRGLRAQLRPYLPLILLGGYLLVFGAGTLGLRLLKRMRP